MGGMARSALTPGRLYSLLSAEFRAMRASECGSCGMPMPYATIRQGEGDSNWEDQQVPSGCEDCAGLVTEIVARVASRYDLFDPTSVPRQRRPV
jgi:hypothetical protein